MGKPFDRELESLLGTLDWARRAELEGLIHSVRVASAGPLVAVGSGGSLSSAHALAQAHRFTTGHSATVLTPMDVVGAKIDAATSVWLLSASGNNVDIAGATRALALREPRQLAAFVGREDSKVASIAASHPYIEMHVFVPPTGKDGFLATNSLFAATALIARAYGAVTTAAPGANALDSAILLGAADGRSEVVARWRTQLAPVLGRDTIIVLHGASTAVGAVDVESKFTEAALGHVQVADYRNFAHGRHHWLAKRAETSAVIALIADEDEEVAARTLALLPAHVPVARIVLPGTATDATITSLLAAFRITQEAGKRRGIDPGDPGVPEFGRKLYHLRPPRARPESRVPGVTGRHAAAIHRKTGRTVTELSQAGDLEAWRVHLRRFERTLATARIAAIVLDYDGTVVDTRVRFDPPSLEMAAELTRLLENGVALGIATGRGKSVRHALQQALPRMLWERVVIGYYNGAVIGTLSDEDTPKQDSAPSAEILQAADALRAHPDISAHTTMEAREHQLTLTGDSAFSEWQLWDIAHGVTSRLAGEFSVVRSSHSVDVLNSSASKLRVGKHLRKAGVRHDILSIGDRGRWPGNDHELLGQPLALSVDECSADPSTCWNLAPAGQRGTAATLHALRSIHTTDEGTVRWR
ncbi:HAD hydrolase family protein [Rathayibacter sp. VKM Ac-2760]|uniref:HAD hydrolase family protein n=1 Tax=Rathayibacter sp. VKM Ac-2760 TaxID=2609253 RepID=UPI001318EF55|nr:HAD hydrolase family protein [Rathayibacter sp. VKM Ac-2760]QHC61140.1 HAD hydrolase family protein [Rathayibacter sp. VKM Ac-2760]